MYRVLKKDDLSFWVLVSGVLFISLLWPEDLRWGGIEEPIIISEALRANAHHELSSYRFYGSSGVRSHSFKIWIYQLALSVTHDLVKIVLVQRLVILLVVLFGIVYLSKALGYNKYMIFIYFFSFVWYWWTKTLYPEIFFIPLSLLIFVSYAAFYNNKSVLPLIIILSCIVVMIHIHPCGFVPALAFGIFFIMFEYKWLKNHFVIWLPIFLATILISTPFLIDIVREMHSGVSPAAVRLYERDLFRTAFVWVTGAVPYSYDFLQLFPDLLSRGLWLPNIVNRIMIFITMTAYLFSLLGMIHTAICMVSAAREGRGIPLENRIGVYCLISLLVNGGIIFLTGVRNHVFYHLSIWFCSFFFIWRVMNRFEKVRGLKFIFPAYIVAMVILWLNMVFYIHGLGGYTLGNALEVARKIARYSPESQVVQMADWGDGWYARLPKIIVENANNAVLGFHYREAFLPDVPVMEKLSKENNMLYLSLAPLVHIYRSEQVKGGGPTRTIVLTWDDSSDREELIVIENPEKVARIIQNLKPES